MKFNSAPFFVFLLLTSVISIVAFAETSVGVAKGDWVEYQVSFTGSPPPEHDVVWARMEVTGVEGARINATFVSQLGNGTVLNVKEDLDFTTGRLIDMFIIPSGLNAGDTFYAQGVGDIAIDRVDVGSAAGSSRKIVHAEAEDTEWSWDRETGVVIEARTATAIYTLDTIATRTGIWNPWILGVDPTVFYPVAVSLIFIVLAGIALFARRKRRMRKSPKSRRPFPLRSIGCTRNRVVFFFFSGLLFAKPPLQVFFSSSLFLFINGFFAGPELISELH